jgi:hypothetical protein
MPGAFGRGIRFRLFDRLNADPTTWPSSLSHLGSASAPPNSGASGGRLGRHHPWPRGRGARGRFLLPWRQIEPLFCIDFAFDLFLRRRCY